MDLIRSIATMTTLALAACSGGSTSGAATNPTTGWPADRFIESAKGIVPAAESVAWRIDTGSGPKIDIWMSGVALDAQSRKLLASSSDHPTNEAVDPDKIGTPGLFLHVLDNGTAAPEALKACADVGGKVTCDFYSSGKVVVSHLDAGRIKGTFYSRSKDRKTLYAAAFDAPVTNTSTAPVPSAVWNENGGDAGAVFLKFMEAAKTKDIATLRSLSMPESSGDWDNPAVVTVLQTQALQQLHVLAGNEQGESAHLSVQATTTGEYANEPDSVEMRKVDGKWKFVKMMM